MFISRALAQVPGLPGGGGGSAFNPLDMLPFLAVFAIMWFFMIRPQQQRMKELRETLARISRGDTVVTNGGIVGKVTRVKDGEGEVEVEIAEGTRVRVVRSMISEVRVKGQPAKDTAKEAS